MPLSKNCYHDPDFSSNTPEIIERHLGKGTVENYTVTTEDGYILTAFRIVRKNPKGVIVLGHPFAVDGIIWVAEGNASLAFTLWRLGYEVWLINNRGTYYSEEHVNLTVNNIKYWDFSFHELGVYDLPVLTEKISEKSNSTELIYVSHSSGSTAATIYASLLPEHAKKHYKVSIMMAPPVFMKHATGISRSLCAYVVPPLSPILRFLGIGGFFTKNSLSKALTKILVITPYKRWLVFLNLFFSGPTPGQVDPKLFNLVFSLIPRGLSLKVAYHFCQAYFSWDFLMWDYGKKENLRRYNSTKPPRYPLQNIQIPIHLITSKNDLFATSQDSDTLWNALPDVAKIYGRTVISGLNHVDFFVGKDRYSLAYDHVLDLLRKM
ncbi:unnamed protein product [Brassicogethes aeneus]|uniref:Lipase n=1 Tax=Brassicogethes aeneus TaxID=1431903 RepID=A0A9P0AX49_BRAAE|nr:unnamed protein product [Brassicogethes aeneus]